MKTSVELRQCEGLYLLGLIQNLTVQVYSCTAIPLGTSLLRLHSTCASVCHAAAAGGGGAFHVARRKHVDVKRAGVKVLELAVWRCEARCAACARAAV